MPKSLATQIVGIGATIGTVWGFVVLPAIQPISNTLSNALVPDICDVDELEGGHRREGVAEDFRGLPLGRDRGIVSPSCDAGFFG